MNENFCIIVHDVHVEVQYCQHYPHKLLLTYGAQKHETWHSRRRWEVELRVLLCVFTGLSPPWWWWCDQADNDEDKFLEDVHYGIWVAWKGNYTKGNWDHSCGTWLFVKIHLVNAHRTDFFVKQENYFETGRFWNVSKFTHLILCRHFTFLLCRLIVWAQQHFSYTYTIQSYLKRRHLNLTDVHIGVLSYTGWHYVRS
jgi:hypothetical protein